MKWTDEDIFKLDARFAKEGIHPHQRPFRAAVELLGLSFSIGGGDNSVHEIAEAYRRLIPEVDSTWPGFGVGIAASMDQVRRITLPVLYGEHSIEVWKELGFESALEWFAWCRKDSDIAAQSSFAYADAHDFAYGLSEVKDLKPAATELWIMARSNLEDVANALPTSFSMDSIVQPVCLIVELALKACLVWHGVDPDSFKGRTGHNLVDLAARLRRLAPHDDDSLIAESVAEMPDYVASRYRPQGLTRLRVVKLALAAQFIAASTLRRVASSNLSSEMGSGGWPAPRPHLFEKP